MEGVAELAALSREDELAGLHGHRGAGERDEGSLSFAGALPGVERCGYRVGGEVRGPVVGDSGGEEDRVPVATLGFEGAGAGLEDGIEDGEVRVRARLTPASDGAVDDARVE